MPRRRRCCDPDRCIPSIRTDADRGTTAESGPARPPSCTAGSPRRPIRRRWSSTATRCRPSASSQLTRSNLRLALPADALQRMEHAIGVIDALEIVIHLGAERAARERMRRIAGQLLGGAVAHLDDPAAGVRTVVAACAANDVHRALSPFSNRRAPRIMPMENGPALSPICTRTTSHRCVSESRTNVAVSAPAATRMKVSGAVAARNSFPLSYLANHTQPV